MGRCRADDCGVSSPKHGSISLPIYLIQLALLLLFLPLLIFTIQPSLAQPSQSEVMAGSSIPRQDEPLKASTLPIRGYVTTFAPTSLPHDVASSPSSSSSLSSLATSTFAAPVTPANGDNALERTGAEDGGPKTSPPAQTTNYDAPSTASAYQISQRWTVQPTSTPTTELTSSPPLSAPALDNPVREVEQIMPDNLNDQAEISPDRTDRVTPVTNEEISDEDLLVGRGLQQADRADNVPRPASKSEGAVNDYTADSHAKDGLLQHPAQITRDIAEVTETRGEDDVNKPNRTTTSKGVFGHKPKVVRVEPVPASLTSTFAFLRLPKSSPGSTTVETSKNAMWLSTAEVDLFNSGRSGSTHSARHDAMKSGHRLEQLRSSHFKTSTQQSPYTHIKGVTVPVGVLFDDGRQSLDSLMTERDNVNLQLSAINASSTEDRQHQTQAAPNHHAPGYKGHASDDFLVKVLRNFGVQTELVPISNPGSLLEMKTLPMSLTIAGDDKECRKRVCAPIEFAKEAPPSQDALKDHPASIQAQIPKGPGENLESNYENLLTDVAFPEKMNAGCANATESKLTSHERTFLAAMSERARASEAELDRQRLEVFKIANNNSKLTTAMRLLDDRIYNGIRSTTIEEHPNDKAEQTPITFYAADPTAPLTKQQYEGQVVSTNDAALHDSGSAKSSSSRVSQPRTFIPVSAYANDGVRSSNHVDDTHQNFAPPATHTYRYPNIWPPPIRHQASPTHSSISPHHYREADQHQTPLSQPQPQYTPAVGEDLNLYQQQRGGRLTGNGPPQPPPIFLAPESPPPTGVQHIAPEAHGYPYGRRPTATPNGPWTQPVVQDNVARQMLPTLPLGYIMIDSSFVDAQPPVSEGPLGRLIFTPQLLHHDQGRRRYTPSLPASFALPLIARHRPQGASSQALASNSNTNAAYLHHRDASASPTHSRIYPMSQNAVLWLRRQMVPRNASPLVYALPVQPHPNQPHYQQKPQRRGYLDTNGLHLALQYRPAPQYRPKQFGSPL